MDDVARLPVTDRSDPFVATARRRGMTAEIIEKDFWVCLDAQAALYLARTTRRRRTRGTEGRGNS